ncbi:TetR/AcrR family transcriptional regulator [Micromonospora globbae]|uniref:TetR/AcrR family transcriptional regulator n=1 Tax=Micromonospora globbae TaxID=1894969 RepID=A0A420F2Y0_9ACTN|nr:TetR/AcrR family transcriptional regulator [Micromonospora globbae]RKF27342.1 TetR/AcrR family transcriptional regulator [Micromonospora globbae]WTF86567.1 TetR/AcrR family transcriptional regulator [Micromonospora globbae]
MGNREALLAGAKTCLLEKGFERTTVRDIATTAGVSMAAIGYHFGSRENLLFQALFSILDEWGDLSGRALVPADAPDLGPAEAYERMWDELLAQARAHPKTWLASMELFMQAQRQPELLPHLTDGIRQGRSGMAAILESVPEPDVSERSVRTLGMVQVALMSGVVIQMLSDPEHAPTGADVVEGLRALAKIIG